MATAQQIAALRLLIAEPNNVSPYDDVALGLLLDAGTNQYYIAADIWDQKAAGAAALVDVSEGGSTRKMGDVYEQYLGMASSMRARSNASNNPPNGLGVRISRLTRP